MADESKHEFVNHTISNTESFLHLENEFLISRLKQEFGGGEVFFSEDCHPDLQNDFLRSVIEVEENYRDNAALITVYQKIREPYLVDERHLNDEGVEHQLRRLQRILFDFRIVVDSIYEKDSRKLYRFIVNDLLPHEVENFEVDGYYTHFCYEEFHPNDEEDVRAYTKDFINEIIDQSMSSEFNHLSATMRIPDGTEMTNDAVFQKISDYYNQFDELQMHLLDITALIVVGEEAKATFNIVYTGKAAGHEIIHVEGEGYVQFVKSYGHFWYINEFAFPGIIF